MGLEQPFKLFKTVSHTAVDESADCSVFHKRVPATARREFMFAKGLEICLCIFNKNSSGDEIANVNFLRRYGTYVLQNTKKENLLRLTN